MPWGRGGWTSALLAAVVVLLVMPIRALADDSPPPGADAYTDAAVLTPNTTWTYQNAGDHATNEPYSATSAKRCEVTNAAMDHTIWFKVIGTGGRIILSTGVYSNFDTLIARYLPNQLPSDSSAEFCNDDFLGMNGGSEMQWTSTIAGAVYYTQWGGCDPNVTMCGTPTGQLAVTAITNDQRAFADSGTGTRSNIGAFTDSGELTSCDNAVFGRTVWFKWTAPSAGRATFTASGGLDAVLAAYLGSSTTPAACNDNAGSTFKSEVSLDVQAGQDVLVQVGGKQISAGQYAQNNFSYSASFAPAAANNDRDGDHSSPPQDCDDTNAAVHPGAKDVPFNNIDEDCVGGDSKDGDGDGYAAKPFGKDCNDQDGAINPGVKERRGNWVDENCDNRATPGPALQADVACRGCGLLLNSVIFGGFRIDGIHKGDVVLVRCRGTRRCPKPVRKVSRKKTINVRYHHTLPRRRAIVEVFVERPGVNDYGYYLRYRNGKRKAGCASAPPSRRGGVPKHPSIVSCPR